MTGSGAFAGTSIFVVVIDLFGVVDGVAGFDNFLFTVESVLFEIDAASGLAFGGLPLFRGVGESEVLDGEVGVVVGVFFGGRPRFRPLEGVVVGLLFVDLDGLPRFRCSVFSPDRAAAFGVRERLRGDDKVGVDSFSSLNFRGRPLVLFFLFRELDFEASLSLSLACAPAVDALRVECSFELEPDFVLEQEGQYHFLADGTVLSPRQDK